MSTAEPRYCYRHPDRETGLSCSDCGRPICADCATFAPVGIRCPDHAGARGGKKPLQIKPPTVHRAQGVALAAGNAPITKALVAINAAIYLITAAQGGGLSNPGGQLFNRMALAGGHWCSSFDAYGHCLAIQNGVAQGEWWRLATSMFLHASILHIGFNMYVLWVIGRPVEQYLGTARYIGLYLVSGLAGGAGAVVQSPPYVPVVGASGAIFGILGAMLILEWQVTGRLAGQAMTLIVLNLGISFVIPNISWGGHIGGLIGGTLITLGYAHWRGGRAQYGKLSVEGIVVLVAVAVASVAIAYFKVRGYA
jgi:membrane associated rhomboid family serine protease